MKYILILSLFLASCYAPRPTSYQMRIVRIAPSAGQYKVTLKYGYKEFISYAKSIDTLYVGQMITIYTIQRVK